MDFKIVFSDIDGTILNSEHRMLKGTLDAIFALKKANIPFVIAIARGPSGVRPIFKRYGFTCPMICYSGALIIDENDKKMYSEGFDADDARDIISYIEAEKIDCTWKIYSEELWIVNDRNDRLVRAEEEIVEVCATEGGIELLPKDAFLLREAKRYDLKGRKEIGALRKYYFCDTGLRNARLNFAFPDEGQMLENIVYNELCYNGYSVNVGAFDAVEKDKNGKSIRKNNEVDFYATKGLRSLYIQVTADISNAETREREIRPFFKLNDQVLELLVVNRPIGETLDENGFSIIGITDFLLKYIK